METAGGGWLDGAEAAEDPVTFAETYGLFLPLESYDLDAPMTYREAVLMLYNALTRAPHDFLLEVVALGHTAEGLSGVDEAQRAVLLVPGCSCAVSKAGNPKVPTYAS